MQPATAVASLSALAHAHRLGAYRLLVEAGPVGLNAGTLAARLALPSSSLTFHLQHLHRAGLVTQTRRGRELIYAADFEVMRALVDYLTENCCRGASLSAAACAPARPPRGAKRARRAA